MPAAAQGHTAQQLIGGWTGRGKVKNRMLTREGGRDAALRFQMDAESCEPAGGEVREMWFFRNGRG